MVQTLLTATTDKKLERANAAYTLKKQLEGEYSLYKIAIYFYLIHYLFHLRERAKERSTIVFYKNPMQHWF